jgi:hypothetical protein
VIVMVDWLSTWMGVGEEVLSLSSVSRHQSQIASFTVYEATMYLASMLERATDVCFFDPQLTATPPNLKINPEVDL